MARPLIRAALPLVALIALTGCVQTLGTIVTAPVKAVAKAADWATVSQDEKDRAMGRALRKRDERLGALERQRQRAQRRCQEGDRAQCDRAEVIAAEMEAERQRPL